ncbi:MAG: ABC transporter substrate-binding protein, partial [Candidatus Heimdallarchaeota archaeon]
TVKINLSNKFVAYYWLLSLPIVDKEFSVSSSDQIGTGPFIKNQSESNGTDIKLNKNVNYNFGTVKVDNVILKYYPTLNDVLPDLENGDVNFVDYNFQPASDSFASIADITTGYGNTLEQEEIGINHQHPYIGTGELIPDGGVTNNNYEQAVLVRKAMSHAVNRTYITENILDKTGVPAATSMPIVSIGKDLSILPRNFSIQTARNYMVMAGFDYNNLGPENSDSTFNKSFFNLTITASNTVANRMSYLSNYAKELQKIGINVSTNFKGWGEILPQTYFYSGPGLVPIFDNGGYDLFGVSYSWAFDYNPYRTYADNGNCDTGNCDNFYNFDIYGNQSRISNLSKSINSELDYNIRMNLTKDLQKEMYDNLPIIPLYHPRELFAYSSNLKGFNLDSIVNVVPDWSGLEVVPPPLPTTSTTSIEPTSSSIITSSSSITTSTSETDTSSKITETSKQNTSPLNIVSVMATFVFIIYSSTKVKNKIKH